MYRKTLTPAQALQKVRQFCAYQERSHQEVREKLFSLGIGSADRDEILARLIEDNFLNEERFARAFAGGKFRMKQWGRRRIILALQLKKVSAYCIRAGLEEIPADAYHDTLVKLARKKYETLRSEQYIVRKAKTQSYLIRKGFEPELVQEVVSALTAG